MTSNVFRHGFYYPDSHNVPLSDIAATLIAHERLLPIIAEILERSVDGLTLQKIEINLEQIKRSSLLEAFLIAIFAVYQKDLEKEVPAAVTALTGIPVSDKYDTLVTVLFMLVLYVGASKLLEKGKSLAIKSSLEAGYRDYVQRAADELGVSTARIEEAVEKAAGRRRLPIVMRAAIDLFRPAKRGGNGRIVPLGLPEIPESTVAEFPSEVALAEMADDTVPIAIPEATLTLRAVDLDKSKSGWAGIIEADGVRTKRLPVQLYPSINREILAGRTTVQVEAILESKITETGKTTPKRIHVLRLT